MRTAEGMFAQRSALVPLNEIAHQAGIGVGTVYRRFPDLQALIQAMFIERFTGFVQLATAAAQQPEPAQALRHYLLEAAQLRARDQALDVIVANADTDAEPLAQLRDELAHLVDDLASRATTAGAVRQDFTSADAYAFIYMIGAAADRTHDIAPDAWRRYADVLLTGFGLPQSLSEHTAMSDGQLRKVRPQPPDAV
jgi:AcrR family transcriptional regulator